VSLIKGLEFEGIGPGKSLKLVQICLEVNQGVETLVTDLPSVCFLTGS